MKVKVKQAAHTVSPNMWQWQSWVFLQWSEVFVKHLKLIGRGQYEDHRRKQAQ